MQTIGRLEKIDFPELKIHQLIAKIDTGAYTSSLHCHSIEKSKVNNISYVTFKILDKSHPIYKNLSFTLPILKEKKITSSSGYSEMRVIIKTPIIICQNIIVTELSLTNRSKMKYPILIGRKVLSNNFLVDVSQKFTNSIQ